MEARLTGPPPDKESEREKKFQKCKYDVCTCNGLSIAYKYSHLSSLLAGWGTSQESLHVCLKS